MYTFVSEKLGEMEVDEDKIINFEDGILAFESSKRFILLRSAKEDFYWLQSLDKADLALPCMNPYVVAPDYAPDIPDEYLEKLGVKTEEDVSVFNIVRIPDNVRDATVNLAAPVIINHNTKQGMQVVLDDPNYTVRHRIFL